MKREKFEKRIIDISKPEFQDCPPTVNGMFLVKRLRAKDGTDLGLLVADREAALQYLSSREEAERRGWLEIYDELS